MDNWMVVFGALISGLGVVLGAFGAHGLRSRQTPEQRATFEIGVRYQLFHGVGLIALGLANTVLGGSSLGAGAGVLFLVGVLLFSGSLYWLSLGGPRWLGPVTPLGGLALIIGWGLFVVAAL